MLASIHPLGERARHNRWLVTAAFYLVGSTVAAAALGGVLGAGGAVLSGPHHPAAGALVPLAAAVCGLAGVAEALPRAVPLPTMRRQVNEDWLRRYRGWVYGLGFGGQLGLGVVTIVTTAAVYAVLALAVLAGWSSAGVARGALAGSAVVAAFGLVRAVPLLLVMGRVREPGHLRTAHRTLAAVAPSARRLAAAGLLVTAGALGLAALR